MNESKQAFAELTPDLMLDAIESTGILCDGRFLVLNSYENRVYQVGVEDSTPLIAKFYRPERWTDEAIQEEHDFTRELEMQEIPVISPIYDDSGCSIHTHEHYRFTLYPRRGGRPPELDNPDHLEQLGRFVGRIHSLGRVTPYKHRAELNVQNFAVEPSQWLLKNQFIPFHLETAYESLIKDVISRIESCYGRAGKVDSIRLHGDFHPGNILWTDDGPHVVDFDDARMGPAIQDLWMFLSGDREYMTARLADLMDGYTQFCDFNPLELHLIEALRTMRMIHHAAWIAKRWDDPAFPMAFPWFDSDRYWEEHILALREQAALMDEPALVWD